MTPEHMMDWGAMGGMMSVAMLIWAILGVALIVLVIIGVVWLVRQLGRNAGGRRWTSSRTAVEELELRYARGEVDRETFATMRDDLERGA